MSFDNLNLMYMHIQQRINTRLQRLKRLMTIALTYPIQMEL